MTALDGVLEDAGVSQWGVAACPAGAGRDVRWRDGVPREQLLDVVACRRESEMRAGEAGGLCGGCLAVCPFGRRMLRDGGRPRPVVAGRRGP